LLEKLGGSPGAGQKKAPQSRKWPKAATTKFRGGGNRGEQLPPPQPHNATIRFFLEKGEPSRATWTKKSKQNKIWGEKILYRSKGAGGGGGKKKTFGAGTGNRKKGGTTDGAKRGTLVSSKGPGKQAKSSDKRRWQPREFPCGGCPAGCWGPTDRRHPTESAYSCSVTGAKITKTTTA